MCCKSSAWTITKDCSFLLAIWKVRSAKLTGEHPEEMTGQLMFINKSALWRASLDWRTSDAFATWTLLCNNFLWFQHSGSPSLKLKTHNLRKSPMMKMCSSSLRWFLEAWWKLKSSTSTQRSSAVPSRTSMVNLSIPWFKKMQMNFSICLWIGLRILSKARKKKRQLEIYSKEFMLMNSFAKVALITVKERSHLW